MCGISGWMRADGGPVNQDIMRAMNTAIAHRGPDGDGFYFGHDIALGHRRLSIIDLEGGTQPMYGAEGQVVIVFNGEIYNYRSLREDLKKLGYGFSTHSDTEVLLKSYLAWGENCVTHLRGMFAFAIWDGRSDTLFLARDRLGIKPLYYSFLPGGDFLFGSELKALTANPGLRRALRLDALEDYLMLGYLPEPKSILSGVSQLEPATSFTLKKGETVGRKSIYWTPGIKEGQEYTSTADELLGQLKQAVDLRLIADVPLGAFLSGGIDSSTVVGLMAELTKGPVQTCAIGTDDPAFDESGLAADVAAFFKTDHQDRRVSPTDKALIDTLASVYDEPFADTSALPTYQVCALSRERVKVALSGDGGDELFAGYRRHRFHMAEEQMRSRLPLALRRAVFGPLGQLYPKMDWAPQFLRAKTTFEALARSAPEAYCHSVSRIPDRVRKLLHSDLMRKRLGGYHPAKHFSTLAEDVKGADPLTQIQYLDLKTYLSGDILTKVDRASMAHGLEVRVPLLDHKFVEWAFRVPPENRLKDGTGKHILRQAIKGLVPDTVLNRPKSGFIVPISNWMRQELAADIKALASDEMLASTGLFNMTMIERLAGQHIRGTMDHHSVLWSLLMLSKSLKHLELETATA